MNTAQKTEPIDYIRLPEVRRITGPSAATIYAARRSFAHEARS